MIRSTFQQGAKSVAKVAPQPGSRSVSTMHQAMGELDMERRPHDAARKLHVRRQQRVQSSTVTTTTSSDINPVLLGQSWPKSALDKQMEALSVAQPNLLRYKKAVILDELSALQDAFNFMPQCRDAQRRVLGDEHHSNKSFVEHLKVEMAELMDAFAPSVKPQCDETTRKVLGDDHHIHSSRMEHFRTEMAELMEILNPPARAKDADAPRLRKAERTWKDALEFEVKHIKRVLLTPDQWKKDAEKGVQDQFKPVARTPTEAAKKELESLKASTIEPPAKADKDDASELLSSAGAADKVKRELGELSHSVSSKSRQEAIDEVEDVVSDMKIRAKEKTTMAAWC